MPRSGCAPARRPRAGRRRTGGDAPTNCSHGPPRRAPDGYRPGGAAGELVAAESRAVSRGVVRYSLLRAGCQGAALATPRRVGGSRASERLRGFSLHDFVGTKRRPPSGAATARRGSRVPYSPVPWSLVGRGIEQDRHPSKRTGTHTVRRIGWAGCYYTDLNAEENRSPPASPLLHCPCFCPRERRVGSAVSRDEQRGRP